MMFQDIKAGMLRTSELATLVRRAQNLTRGSYNLYDKNSKTLSALLKKILKISKQENEWYTYFFALYYLMYLNMRAHNYKEIVKYAEVYYKDSLLYMDKELPNYPGTYMAALNVWICDKIFEAYYHYHQIDDAKMDAFMCKYEDTTRKYGKMYDYYISKMLLGILYHNVDETKKSARKFLECEREITSCYVCAHRAYLRHFLLLDQDRQAESLMLDLIHKNIPKRHLWCYQRCEEAEPASMYAIVLNACVWNGKKNTFDYFFEKYWSGLPHESRRNSDSRCFERLLCVFANDFEGFEDDLRQTLEDIDKEEQRTTVDNMWVYLNWWCYYVLLDKSGVHSISVVLPELEADENGKVSTLAVSTYMEKKADMFGRQFAQARAAFDYEFVKNAYQKCFL